MGIGNGNGVLGMGNGALGIGKREAGRLGKRGRVGECENLPSSFFLLPSSFPQTCPMRSTGQNRTTARPMIFCFGKNPHLLESLLLLRLSPITKY